MYIFQVYCRLRQARGRDAAQGVHVTVLYRFLTCSASPPSTSERKRCLWKPTHTGHDNDGAVWEHG